MYNFKEYANMLIYLPENVFFKSFKTPVSSVMAEQIIRNMSTKYIVVDKYSTFTTFYNDFNIVKLNSDVNIINTTVSKILIGVKNDN
jgi:hypothetical protein